MTRTLTWLLLCILPLLATAEEAPLRLAWKTADGYELVHLNTTQVLNREPLPADLQTPLGSLWKLFVYAWLAGLRLPRPGPRGSLLLYPGRQHRPRCGAGPFLWPVLRPQAPEYRCRPVA